MTLMTGLHTVLANALRNIITFKSNIMHYFHELVICNEALLCKK